MREPRRLVVLAAGRRHERVTREHARHRHPVVGRADRQRLVEELRSLLEAAEPRERLSEVTADGRAVAALADRAELVPRRAERRLGAGVVLRHQLDVADEEPVARELTAKLLLALNVRTRDLARLVDA